MRSLRAEIRALVRDVRAEFGIDPRAAVWDVRIRRRADAVEVAGATTEPAALATLLGRVRAADPAVPVLDRVARLPLGAERPLALVRVAVAPLLAAPLISAAPLSEVLLGSVLTVLRRRRRWLQCRAADGYVGWVHSGYLAEVTPAAAARWAAAGEAISLGAELREGSSVLARLPWGARFVVEAGRGMVPGELTGEVEGAWIPASERASRFPPCPAAVLGSAMGWLGAPYRWGGATVGGVDCSGLVQTVLRMHGVELPRDSDQQARCGEPVLPGRSFAGVRAGDLLFFAERRGRISHVALSRGGSSLVHASLGNARVACNDLKGDSDYERELRGFFVAARRILPGDPG